MLEEAADDGADANSFRQAFDAGAQDAEAADDQVDFDAGLRGLVKGFDHAGSSRAFILATMCAGRPAWACSCSRRMRRRKLSAMVSGATSRGQIVVDLGVGGEVIEDHVHPLGDLRIAGKQAQVGIEAGGDGVVVAGAQVAIAAGHAVFVAADQHGQLAVGLEADDAVEDLHAGIFHAARPADVRGLVEAGHQLDNQRGLLGGGGLDQRLEDGRIVAGAVEGLLHGDDGGSSRPAG